MAAIWKIETDASAFIIINQSTEKWYENECCPKLITKNGSSKSQMQDDDGGEAFGEILKFNR